MKPKTIGVLLQGARPILQNIGIESAALDARLLLQAALGLSHEQIIADADAVVDQRSIQIFDHYVSRRARFEPVSRILGSREFYGRAFRVTPAVLDPRADTECVVDLALGLIKGHCTFLDLGTGNGAIAITLCAERKDWKGTASDISQEALDVAKGNASANNILHQLQFHCASWFDGLSENFDLIISNPPYIKSDAALMPDVKNFDPHLALFGGEEGLDAYRAIAQGAASHLKTNGFVVVEIGAGQEDDIVNIFSSYSFKLVKSAQDLSGHTRGLAFQL